MSQGSAEGKHYLRRIVEGITCKEQETNQLIERQFKKADVLHRITAGFLMQQDDLL